MRLTQEEKDILNGKRGEIVAKLMGLLVKMGETRDAEEMIDVYSVHASPTLSEYTGYPGIELMEDIRNAGVKFKVLTTDDPVSIDIEDWASLGIAQDYADMQLRSIKAFADCGGIGIHSCTPWLCGNVPRYGQHLAWVETSAVIYANSIIGARTNRHVDPSALAAAICGKTPKYGLHLDENRKGEVLVEVKTDMIQTLDYTALGAYVASKCGPKVYVFDGIPRDVTMESVILMSSAMSTWGNVAMYHIVGITPEARTTEDAFAGNEVQEHIVVGRKELNTIYDQFPRGGKGKKLVLFGCPFCTFKDLEEIAGLIDGRRVHEDIALWVSTSRLNRNIGRENGCVSTIEKAGGKVIAGICWLNSPVLDVLGFESVATNSAKGAFIVRGKNRATTLASTADCIDIAVRGE